MQVIYVDVNNLSEIQKTAPDVAMALGYFDGVHLGHQDVIKTAYNKAKEHDLSLAVLSFFPHPKSVLQPDIPVRYLEPIDQKIKKLERLGVSIFYIVEFTKEFSSVEGNEFLNQYVKGLNAKEIICGFDYKYGKKSAGSTQTLAEYAEKENLGFTVVEELKWKNQKISSTLIRQFLSTKQLKYIPQLTGEFHKTKYCKEKGLLPNYSLPSIGDYLVLIEKNGYLIEHAVTVKSANKILIHKEDTNLPNVLTIQWVDKL